MTTDQDTISEQPISSLEICNFFINGFINGFIQYHEVVSNINEIALATNGKVKIATWKMGFAVGAAANENRRN